MTDRRRHSRWSQAPRYLAPVRPWWCYPKWLMPVLVGGLMILNAAPEVPFARGSERLASLTKGDASLRVAAPYKRNAAPQPSTATLGVIPSGAAAPSKEGVGQGEVAVAAPRFVAPARRDREDAPRGKLLGNQDEVQAWHSGRGAAPIQGLTRNGRAFVLHRLEGPLTEFVVVFTTERR